MTSVSISPTGRFRFKAAHRHVDLDDLLRRADAELYAAKHAGRNRLECDLP